MRKKLEFAVAGLLISLSVHAGRALADEGMWLLNSPPVKQLEDRYGFTPTAEWLEHIQKSCVRFGRGGSASLVSPNGLVMTNHHVGRGQLQKLSTKERNLLETGFYAPTNADELKCGALEANILWSIKDVTESVRGAAQPGMSAAEANQARKRRIADITKESLERSGLKSDVVTLYHGARYHLYQYKRYTDVRLVMAPEGDIAHFGGDTDNFEYPRFCLDMTFFRIYEDGKPLVTDHFLPWSSTGASEGDLVFVAGHPGRTRRLYTVDHLKFLRDVVYPLRLQSLWRSEVKYQTFAGRGAENRRIADGFLSGVKNGRKAQTGMLAGLHDPALMQDKAASEAALRAAIRGNPEHQLQWGGAWEKLKSALDGYRGFYLRHTLLEGRGVGGGSRLFSMARRLVRMAEELPKPNADRLRGYRDSDLDSLYLRLYSAGPIYDDLEIERLASSFSLLAETLGGDSLFVSKVLAGRSPRARALDLVTGTKLKDVAVRKRLAEGGAAAIAASTDPMIRLAYELDPEARALRKRVEDEVESVEQEAYTAIAAAEFAVHGEGIYPDATGSLRLTFGTVKGYEENGRSIPPLTKFEGLYKRHQEREGADPFSLDDRWLSGKDKLDLSVPFNFVCTTDVVGGNSGSPVFNARGEVVGLVFDINLYSLVWDVTFTDRQARTVAVHSRAIIEALRKIYGAGRLADEIVGR